MSRIADRFQWACGCDRAQRGAIARLPVTIVRLHHTIGGLHHTIARFPQTIGVKLGAFASPRAAAGRYATAVAGAAGVAGAFFFLSRDFIRARRCADGAYSAASFGATSLAARASLPSSS